MPLLELVVVVVGTAMMVEIIGPTDMVALVALLVSLVAPLPTAVPRMLPTSAMVAHNPLLVPVVVGAIKPVIMVVLVVLAVPVPVATVVAIAVVQMRAAAAVALVAGATTAVAAAAAVVVGTAIQKV